MFPVFKIFLLIKEYVLSKLTLDGKEYAIASLSEAAKAQVTNLQVSEAKVQELQQMRAILMTARNAYALALKNLLPSKAHPNKKKGVISIDGVSYELEKFSEQAQAELASLQLVDNKLAENNALVAMIQTARNAYVSALQGELN